MKQILFIIAVLIALPAWSKPIGVKSGEHGAFTRLVVYFSPEQKWDLVSVSGLTTLTVKGWTQGFDISDAFTRIDNERVRSLTASDASLVMALNCDCEVVAEAMGNGLVILDIKEVALAQTVQAERFEEISDRMNGFEPVESQAADETILPVILPAETDFSGFEKIVQSNSRSQAETFQRGLGEELARSSTLTYLEPSGAELPTSNFAKPTHSTRTEDELLALLSLRAQFTNAGTQRSSAKSEPTFTCPDPREFAVSSWGGDLPFAEQLAYLRTAMYSEFDELDQAAVRDLVRLYVHYSLSPEARRTIENLSDGESLNTLGTLARVLEGESETMRFDTELSNCEGETGFWSFVGDGNSQISSDERIEDIVATFQKLPLHLKELTADRVITILEEQDFGVAAGIIKNSMTRDIKFEQPIPALRSNLASKSQDELLALVENNDELSPEALEVLLRNGIDTGQPAEDDLIELTSSYIHQLKGTEIAKRLASLQISDLARSKKITGAATLLFGSDEGDLFEPGKLRATIVKMALLSGKVAEVSDLMLRLDRREYLVALPEALRIEVADFFSKQGQPQLARMAISGLNGQDGAVEIIANTHMQSGQYEDALKLINEVETPELGLSISRMLLLEKPSEAWEERERLSGAVAQEAAWMTQNWQDVPPDSARNEVAKLITQSSGNMDTTGKPIQDSLTAFSDSKNARRVLSQLLNTDVLQN